MQISEETIPHSQPKKNSLYIIRLPLIIALALSAGILIGSTMFGGSKNLEAILTGHEKFKEILSYIDRDYVDSVDTEELVDYGIEKMLEKLDPHTTYIPIAKVEAANDQLRGDFEGVGIEFNIFKDTLYVIAPLSGGPSEEAGILTGDKIISVDDENIASVGLDNFKVFKLLRGKKGTEVKLGIKRKNVDKILYFTIERDKIPTFSVDVSYMIDANTGYIKVSRFAENTYKEFQEALKKLMDEGMKRLMVDLRGNPGGYMDRAINMVDEILAENPMIVYTDGKGRKYDSEAKAHIDGIFETGPVIVLIDEGSASASEIFAGALQDNDRALIVGRRSFGKGLVQMPIDLSDGSELRLTISRYYTPSGRSIQKPYDDIENYKNDLLNRMQHGEFYSADSIQFADSLKFKTANGRTVYGGGGIMPDYFVPLDTSINVKYLNQLANQNIIREYALKYYGENKTKLDIVDYEVFKETFEVNQSMLQEVIEMGKKANVEFDEELYQSSKEDLKLRIKALIARHVWGYYALYPIMHKRDDVFEQALKLFDEAQNLSN